MLRTNKITREIVLVASIVIGGFGCARASQTQFYTVDKVRKWASQNELDRRKEEENTQQKVQQRHSWLTRATNVLEELKKTQNMAVDYFRRLDDLLYSDQGKRIVRYGTHFNSYVILRRYPVLSLSDMALRIDRASAYVKQIKTASQEPDVGYVPNAEITNGIQSLEVWSSNKLAGLHEARGVLGELLRYNPTDIDLASTETLAEAFEAELSRPTLLHAKGRELGIQDANPEVIATHRRATHLAETQHAQTTSDVMLAEEKQKNEDLKTQSDIRIMKMDQESQTEYTGAEENYENNMIGLQIQKEKGRIERRTQMDEARRSLQWLLDENHQQQRIAKALSSRVQEVLAPFTARSFYQYKLAGGSFDKEPMSLSRLVDLGALRQDTSGLRVLTEIAGNPWDTERPRWPFGMYYVKLNDREKAYVREAHGYLTELGTVLVQLGYLAQ